MPTDSPTDTAGDGRSVGDVTQDDCSEVLNARLTKPGPSPGDRSSGVVWFCVKMSRTSGLGAGLPVRRNPSPPRPIRERFVLRGAVAGVLLATLPIDRILLLASSPTCLRGSAEAKVKVGGGGGGGGR